MKRILFSIALCVTVTISCRAQQDLPFYNEVQNLTRQDSVAFPEPNQILFIGSSSFTIWKDVQEYFPDHKILNRAFGGSSLPDLIRYRYEVLYPYAPKQVVIYCGENDFAADTSLAVSVVVNRFKTLYQLLRAKYPVTPVLYVSMKPSPSRAHLQSKYKMANTQIESWLATQPHSDYVDVFSAMLLPDGSPMTDIFLQDNLHMNAKGYAIWQKLLLPHLIR